MSNLANTKVSRKKQTSPKGYIYCLHYLEPLPTSSRQVQHYVGFAENLEARLKEHRQGIRNHNALPMAFYEHGITFRAHVITEGTRHDERLIKNRKKSHTRICPECQKQTDREKGEK